MYIMFSSFWRDWPVPCIGFGIFKQDGPYAMRDRKLTGPWAGFAFKGGRLITPEGRELEPQDLAWLGLTAALAQEWRCMMVDARTTGTDLQQAGHY